MNENSILKLNEKFNAIDSDITKINILDSDIDEYNILLEKIKSKKAEIDSKIKNSNFYFDETIGVLKEKSKLVFCIKKMVLVKEKNTNKYKIINEIIKITEKEFIELEKYIKEDKEIACSLLNNKEIKCLQDLQPYFSNFTCGICSTNNIKSIRTNISHSSKINIIYEVNFTQTEKNIENIIGSISVFTTSEDYFEENKYCDKFEFKTIF